MHPVREGAALLLDGRPIETSLDVAKFFDVSHAKILYALYRAPEPQRYKAFEIAKRSGGVRLLHSPVGVIREMQTTLAPHLQALYDAHPNAHGFIKERSILTNAKLHVGARYVLNIDLEDFFPSINFGRVRGLFMASPFQLGAAAATVLAQLCTHRNGLPQGAPTSPALSNFIAADLDRRLTRLARENGARYSRYADDITFSSNHASVPPALAVFREVAESSTLDVGAPLEAAIVASGFTINLTKVRLQSRHVRQNVTGLTVNDKVNVTRKRIRRLRAMLHAWEKFGIDNAASDHFVRHRGLLHVPRNAGRAFRNIVYGQLSFIKMVRGADDPVFLNFCAKILALDPNPSKFIRQMVFGADDYDVFISHASEDKEEIARPIFEACARLGIKAFLDEAHIGWGQSFTQKINVALGSARTVLAIVSNSAVSKEWPIAEINAALALEINRQKKVVPLMVGKPDLSRLPLIKGKNHMVWSGDAMAVAKRLQAALKGDAPQRPAAPVPPPISMRPFHNPVAPLPSVPAIDGSRHPPFQSTPQDLGVWKAPSPRKRTLLDWLLGRS